MWKSPNDTHLQYSPIRRNHQIRRILLLLLVIVMLLLTGMLINGRGMGQSPQIATSTDNEPTLNPNYEPYAQYTKQTYQTQEEIASQNSSGIPTSSTNSPDSLSSPGLNIAPTPTQTIQVTHTQTSTLQEAVSHEFGTLFLSIDEGGYKHLFAYHPQTLPFTRLTFGSWDDINPSISPSGTQLAFASNRNGYWDIYVLNLTTGATIQVTDTPEYDGAPSWSPDSNWLVYESYTTPNSGDTSDLNSTDAANNLDIFILQVDRDNPETGESIRLTNHPGIDYAPAWSPTGRNIVFVSTRSGDSDIWLADLDKIDDRFINVSQKSGTSDTYPAWSPDGNSLAWASTANGYQDIYIYDIAEDLAQPRIAGTGNRPVWSPDGGTLFTSLLTPNRTYLTGYSIDSDGLALPPIPLIGSLAGLTWSNFNLPDPLPASLAQIAEANPTPSWQVALENSDGTPGGRRLVVPILDVEAPYPMLQDLVDESFIALREALATRIGWDYLSTLENAYVPLTSPLSPGKLEDWLYTGRAFTLNPVVINAGWMVVMREDFGSETYWRVYLRARFQDGSQGMPLYNLPWDLNARYSGDPRTYEQGGAPVSSIPPGYWLDYTQLAASFGWQRLPALSTWRSAIPSARYNEFVLIDGLDWYSAMLEIYPPEAINTPKTGYSLNNIISVR